MSLFESGHSTGDVSLTKLLQGDVQPGQAADLSVPDLMERIVIGGWPALLDAGQDEARAWLTDYIRQVAEVDLPSLGPAGTHATSAVSWSPWRERSANQQS